MKLHAADFLKVAIVSPWDFGKRLKEYVRLSMGRLEGEWENALFPPSAVAERRRTSSTGRAFTCCDTR